MKLFRRIQQRMAEVGVGADPNIVRVLTEFSDKQQRRAVQAVNMDRLSNEAAGQLRELRIRLAKLDDNDPMRQSLVLTEVEVHNRYISALDLKTEFLTKLAQDSAEFEYLREIAIRSGYDVSGIPTVDPMRVVSDMVTAAAESDRTPAVH